MHGRLNRDRNSHAPDYWALTKLLLLKDDNYATFWFITIIPRKHWLWSSLRFDEPCYKYQLNYNVLSSLWYWKTADDLYRISIAVAGFSDADLNVEVKNKTLIISGKKDDSTTDKNFLHKGIATRAFERTFHLADYVKVKGASHSDGMLHIDVFREVPEELKPRQIEIAVQGSTKPVIEH